jgi:hypothetical protein
MGIYQGKITGKLIIKLANVGTKSEGPSYFIVPINEYAKWDGIHICKPVHLWEADPVLEKYRDQTITVMGEITETKDTITIDYKELEVDGQRVLAFQPPPPTELSTEDFVKALGNWSKDHKSR